MHLNYFLTIVTVPAAPSVSADATYCSFTSPSDILAIAGLIVKPAVEL